MIVSELLKTKLQQTTHTLTLPSGETVAVVSLPEHIQKAVTLMDAWILESGLYQVEVAKLERAVAMIKNEILAGVMKARAPQQQTSEGPKAQPEPERGGAGVTGETQTPKVQRRTKKK